MDSGHTGDSELRELLVRAHLDSLVVEVPELAVEVDVVSGGVESLDDVQGFPEPRGALARVELEEPFVADQATAAETVYEPAVGQVVEEGEPLGDHEGVVIGQVDRPRTEADPMGHRRRLGEEDVGGRDVLVGASVMLAHPNLVVTEPIGQRHLLELQVIGQRPVGPRERFGHQEQTKSHDLPPKRRPRQRDLTRPYRQRSGGAIIEPRVKGSLAGGSFQITRSDCSRTPRTQRQRRVFEPDHLHQSPSSRRCLASPSCSHSRSEDEAPSSALSILISRNRCASNGPRDT